MQMVKWHQSRRRWVSDLKAQLTFILSFTKYELSLLANTSQRESQADSPTFHSFSGAARPVVAELLSQ